MPRPPPVGEEADPAWDIGTAGGGRIGTSSDLMPDLPLGPPAARPPRFGRERWAEIVHKMVAAYGAPVTPEQQDEVVDYLMAVRPPGPDPTPHRTSASAAGLRGHMSMTKWESDRADMPTIPALIRWHGYAAAGECALRGRARANDVDPSSTRRDWLGGHPLAVVGAAPLRPHSGLFFGWLGNAFLAFLYFVVPRLAARPVTSRRGSAGRCSPSGTGCWSCPAGHSSRPG